MPQYQFLDRIINTVSLQTKPTNKYKKSNNVLLRGLGATLITNQLNTSPLAISKSLELPNTNFSFLTELHIEGALVDTNWTFTYFNSSTSLEISDSFSPILEYHSSSTIAFFPQISESSNAIANENAYLILNLDQNISTSDPLALINYKLVNSNSVSFTAYSEIPYQAYPLSYSYSGIINTSNYLYIPKVNDDMILALDLEFNKIFEYIEPQDVEEYVPPNPEDLTIITLKEFWG
jgi:hypothetical protein